MTFQEFAKTLDYRSMDTFPWQSDPDCDYEVRFMVPAGVVVQLERFGGISYELYGQELAGRRTQGCDCCSREYDGNLAYAIGWAWVSPSLAK